MVAWLQASSAVLSSILTATCAPFHVPTYTLWEGGQPHNHGWVREFKLHQIRCKEELSTIFCKCSSTGLHAHASHLPKLPSPIWRCS